SYNENGNENELLNMRYRLVTFDLDGCLTEKDDSWAFIHRKLGVWERAKRHRKMFFNGEINYQEWADLDVGLWKGTSYLELSKIIRQIKIRPHIGTTIQELKNRKIRVIIISSGLSLFADRIKREFDFDFAIANTPIVTAQNILTGECDVKVKYDDKHKVLREVLTKNLDQNGIGLKDCIAIGDGENDIPLFNEVGFSIAFNPINELVAKSADVVVIGGLLDVLSVILSRVE
ncbi:MAG: HAD family hydrolase, partial [Candidatus Helarchaeota archaeon]